MIVVAVAGALACGWIGYSVWAGAQEAGGFGPFFRHLSSLAAGLVLFALIVLPGLWIAVVSHLLQEWIRG